MNNPLIKIKYHFIRYQSNTYKLKAHYQQNKKIQGEAYNLYPSKNQFA